MARYHAKDVAPNVRAIAPDMLDAVVREGAQRLLQAALVAEVDEYLERPRYARGGRISGYRNGYAREREVGVGTWSLTVRPPRVSDLPADATPFTSKLLPRRRYLSVATQRLFARLYLEGLSSGDFEPAFRELMGEKATLSASTIVRLKAQWETEYAAWGIRPINERHAYVWCDGIGISRGPGAASMPACWW